MAKRTKKNDPQQKNKQGFDSAAVDSEFGHVAGSAEANRLQKEKEKYERALFNKHKNGQ